MSRSWPSCFRQPQHGSRRRSRPTPSQSTELIARRCARLTAKSAAVNDAVAHHPGRSDEFVEVLEGISVDDGEVGEFVRFQSAEVMADAEKSCGDDGRRAQCRGRGQPADVMEGAQAEVQGEAGGAQRGVRAHGEGPAVVDDPPVDGCLLAQRDEGVGGRRSRREPLDEGGVPRQHVWCSWCCCLMILLVACCCSAVLSGVFALSGQRVWGWWVGDAWYVG